jgi:hypothetical protein
MRKCAPNCLNGEISAALDTERMTIHKCAHVQSSLIVTLPDKKVTINSRTNNDLVRRRQFAAASVQFGSTSGAIIRTVGGRCSKARFRVLIHIVPFELRECRDAVKAKHAGDGR